MKYAWLLLVAQILVACGDVGGLDVEPDESPEPGSQTATIPAMSLVDAGPLYVDEFNFNATVGVWGRTVDDNESDWYACLDTSLPQGFEFPVYFVQSNMIVRSDVVVFLIVTKETDDIPTKSTNRRFITIPAGHSRSRLFYFPPDSPSHRITILDPELRSKYVPTLVGTHPTNIGKLYPLDKSGQFTADEVMRIHADHQFQPYSISEPATLIVAASP